MKSIIITGGTGFIGANVIYRLLSKKYHVHCIVKPHPNTWRLTPVQDQLSFYPISLSDRQGLTDLFHKIHPTVIIHLAAYGSRESENNLPDIMETNIIGLQNLLLASQSVPYAQFINTGSSSEYGLTDVAKKESDTVYPNSFYAVSKVAASHFCQVFSQSFNKSIVTIRPFSVYGPYEPSTRFIPTIMNAVIKNDPIHLTAGIVRRDFIYIDDLIDLYMRFVESKEHYSGTIVNGGVGKEYTNDEIVSMLFTVAGKTVPIEKGAFPYRHWDTTHWLADITFAKKIIGWQASTSLRRGLEQTYHWFQENQKLYSK